MFGRREVCSQPTTLAQETGWRKAGGVIGHLRASEARQQVGDSAKSILAGLRKGCA